jgi:hypothetical protein
MLANKWPYTFAKWVFWWSLLAMFLQIAIYLLGAEYDSRIISLRLLWWITQLVIIPIWIIFEGLLLLGAEVTDYIYSLTINLFLMVVSFMLMLTKMVKRG